MPKKCIPNSGYVFSGLFTFSKSCKRKTIHIKNPFNLYKVTQFWIRNVWRSIADFIFVFLDRIYHIKKAIKTDTTAHRQLPFCYEFRMLVNAKLSILKTILTCIKLLNSESEMSEDQLLTVV